MAEYSCPGMLTTPKVLGSLPCVMARNTTMESPSRQAVRDKLTKGWTPREIALVLGISTQAVYQHIKRIRAVDEREERAS